MIVHAVPCDYQYERLGGEACRLMRLTDLKDLRRIAHAKGYWRPERIHVGMAHACEEDSVWLSFYGKLWTVSIQPQPQPEP